MILAGEYTVADAEFNDTAIRMRMDNTLPDEYLRNAIAVAEHILVPLKNAKVVSWYRSPTVHRAMETGPFLKHCVDNNIHVCERAWQDYSRDALFHTAQCVVIRRFENDVEVIKELDFHHAVFEDHTVSISYIGENNLNYMTLEGIQ